MRTLPVAVSTLPYKEMLRRVTSATVRSKATRSLVSVQLACQAHTDTCCLGTWGWLQASRLTNSQLLAREEVLIMSLCAVRGLHWLLRLMTLPESRYTELSNATYSLEKMELKCECSGSLTMAIAGARFWDNWLTIFIHFRALKPLVY